jgi:agmatine/peptidylarginine deiminase
MRRILLFLAVSVSISVIGQQNNLPAGMAPGEPALMPAYLNTVQPMGITTPPASPVRTAAEWEEIQALTITWTSYTSVHRQIILAAQLETQVYIICSDSNIVKNNLTANSVPLTNVHYIIAPYNSVWIRDYGQNSCYTNDVDSLVIVDWIYNRPRPKDDTVPKAVALTFNVPLYTTTQAPYDLIHTGGNFMSDGLGTAFSSELVVDENPNHTVAEIDSIMSDFMGINRYVKMPTLPYDGIHHIDMHIKLLDEQTLLVGQYPVGVADGPQIEANLQYVLSTFVTPNGTPYRVIRIPQPPEQMSGDYPDQGGDYLTYANATFVNKTIIVPQYYQQYDTTALRIWREACPGYNVVGINSNSTISASGSLHCITHCVATSDPLLISHFGLPNTTNTITPYQVDARIQHRTGIATATLYWTTDTLQPYQSVPMALTNVALNTWTGFIPAQPVGTHVYYYIGATAVSGKTQVRPMPAPDAYFPFEVTGTTSITENAAPLFANAFPNPSHGLTCVPLNMPVQDEGRLMLIDMMGREVMVVHEGTFVQGDKKYFLNTETLEAGAYQLVLITNNYRAAQPLMVR